MHRHPPDSLHPQSRLPHDGSARYEPRSRHSTHDSRPRSVVSHDRTPISNSTAESQAQSHVPRHDRHDSRFHHHTSHASIAEKARHVRDHPPKARRSWPPQPYVEDERTSLRRESGIYRHRHDAAQEEVPFRGLIDQEPLMIDVTETLHTHERRSGRSAKAPSHVGMPTPPTSEDERARKARRKPSRLNVHKEDHSVPDLSKRTASPYAFTRSSTSSRDGAPSTLTPLSAGYDSTKFARTVGDSKPKSPRNESRNSADYFGVTGGSDRSGSAIDDSFDSDRSSYRQEKKIVEKPLTESPRTSTIDFGSLGPNAVPNRKLNFDSRRNTDTQNTLPTLGRFSTDKSRGPIPPATSTSLSEARNASPLPSASLDLPSTTSLPYARSRESSYASSRGPSPARSVQNGVTPPSRSPRVSADFSRESSILGSRPPSATSSRPASPSTRLSFEAPRTARLETDLAALLTANVGRRAMQSSSSSSSRTTDTYTQEQSAGNAKGGFAPDRPPQSSNLPYPEDWSLMGGSITMPDEQHHAYYPVANPTSSEAHPINGTRSSIPSVPSTSSRNSAGLGTARPVLTRGFSANAMSSSETRSAEPRSPRPFEMKRAESFATTSDARKELLGLLKKQLPACSRPDFIAGYDDWYTVSGASNLDVCPDCITFFERTVFRSHFRRSLPRDLSTKVQCAFGSPWIRLAWVLTLQQHRTDLSLLKDLAEIEDTTDPCPGNVESAQSWYGLRDLDGRFVRDFHICFRDVRKIERLLPTLAGMFVKLPSRSSTSKPSSSKHMCAIRTQSTRFSTYLDAVMATHERAITSRKAANPMALIELIEHKTQLRECPRDHMQQGGLWHLMPDLPVMTVCEDCFESVVEPKIVAGSSLARKFNRTVQPAYGEGLGSTCQLYSWRMRKVFQRAVEDADLKYLARKVKERRETELYLQKRWRDIRRRSKRLSEESDGGPVNEDDKRRLNRELEKISHEWKSKWE